MSLSSRKDRDKQTVDPVFYSVWETGFYRQESLFEHTFTAASKIVNDIEQKQRRLAELIAHVLGEGIRITGKIQAYIDTTFSNPDDGEITHMLTDPLHDDHEMVLELLLYPDEFAQVQFETCLKDADFRADDAERIAAMLGRRCVKIPVYRGHEPAPFTWLSLTQYSAFRYVSRLNIHWKPNAKLHGCLEALPEGPSGNQIRVKLRNAHLNPTGNQIDLFCRFLGKAALEHGDFLSGLEFLLTILPEIYEDTDIYAFLAERKRFYFLSIGKARQIEAQHSKHNMETLMMRGIRAPHVDVADAKRKMRLIDALSRTVFGRTEYFIDTPADVDLGEATTLGDLGRILGRLD